MLGQTGRKTQRPLQKNKVIAVYLTPSRGWGGGVEDYNKRAELTDKA
jgi:hypothetical protein